MENNTKVCIVKNRSASRVIYRIPELGIRREFSPTETKKVSYEELEKLSYQPGGLAILTNFLQILDDPSVQDLGIKAEPEYHMSEQQVVELLQKGSLDAFLDCLDFAPVGVIDLVKTFAVSLPLTDYEKRKALKAKTGFDVDKAITNERADKEPEVNKIEEKPAERRVKTDGAPTRRRTTTNYKVVSKSE